MYLRRTLFFAFTLVLFFHSRIFSQSPYSITNDVLIDVYNERNGLESLSITDLTIDSNGLIYLSSFKGIYRFDGSRFSYASGQEFIHLPGNRYTFINARPDSTFLIRDEYNATYLSEYSDHTVLQSPSTTSTILGIVANDVESDFFMDSLHIYTLDTNNVLKSIARSEFGTIKSCFVDRNGVFWFQTRMGIVRCEVNGRQLLIPNEDLPFNFDSYPNGLRPLTFSPLSSGVGVVGFSGVAILDHSGLIQFSSSTSFGFVATSLLELHDGNYLVSGLNGFATIKKGSNTLSFPDSLSTLSSRDLKYPTLWNGKPLIITYTKIIWGGDIIFETKQPQQFWKVIEHPHSGELWIATRSMGLIRLAPNPFEYGVQNTAYQQENTYGISINQKTVFIASFDNGVFGFQGKKCVYADSNHRLARTVLVVPSWNKIIKGYWGGLATISRISGVDETPITFVENNPIFDYADDNSMDFIHYSEKQDELLLGDHLHLAKTDSTFQTFQEIFTSQGEPLPGVRSISPLENNRYLLGTRTSGLYVYDGKQTKNLNKGNNELALRIRDILSFSKNTYWLATEGKGLQIITIESDSVEKVRSISITDGLPVNTFHKILRDSSNRLWVSSNSGLFCFDEERTLSYLKGDHAILGFKRFSELNGLPTREFNGGVSNAGGVDIDGNFYFPSIKGVIRFHPDKIDLNRPKDHLFIESIRYGNTISYFPDNRIILDPQYRDIEVQIGSTQFQFLQPNIVEYKRQESNGEWLKLSTESRLTLASLPPGEYTYQFRIKNAYQASDILAVKLVANPFFYETGWFTIVLVMVGLGLMLGAFIWYRRNNERRRDKLESEVARRTLQYQKAKKDTEKALKTIENQAAELQAISRYKEDIVIGMTHELKTPLSLILGPITNIQDALHRGSEERIDMWISMISKNANRLKSLIEKVLRTAKYTTDENVLNIQNIRSDILSEDIIKHISIHFLNETHRININSRHKVVSLEVDKMAVTLMVGNLVSNALKFSKDDVKISIKTTPTNYQIEIQDNGLGISESDLPRIFDPYFRGNIPDNIAGHGIGLTLVKRFAALLNANINIRSEPGNGSTFTISLPISSQFLSLEAPETIPVTGVQKSLSEHSNDKKIRVLLVDDNPEFYSLIEHALPDSIELSFATDARMALQLIASATFDVLITDIMMPEISGFDLVEQLSQLSLKVNMGIIFISALDGTSTMEKGFELGAEAFLPKPVDFDLLKSKIYSIVDRNAKLEALKQENKPNLQKNVEAIILRHLDDAQLSVDFIAQSLNISKSALYNKWRNLEIYSINELIIRIRIRHVFKLIKEQGYNISEASQLSGFKYGAYFSRVFKKRYKISPKEYLDLFPDRLPDLD